MATASAMNTLSALQRATVKWIRARIAIRALWVAPCFAASFALAQAPDASDVAEGMRLFQQKANCQACHGWAGDGRKMDNQMPDAPSLRETRLDRAAIVMTIKCGRPGRGMPAFDKFAYSDGRCYGTKLADLAARHLTLPDPAATLQAREIELLTDFLFAKIVGQGAMDRAKCAQYWGAAAEVCGEFPR
jgi:mono/diheme cytochrome c family protein